MTARRRDRFTRDQHKRILQRSTICHICGHDGADAVDHIIPLARGGSDDLTNKAPAHHNQPCPTCKIKCNRVKGTKIVPKTIRRSKTLNLPET